MWSVIENDKVQAFFEYFPDLYEYKNEIILYSNDKYSFVPRYFYKKHPMFCKLLTDEHFKPKPLDTNIVFKKQLRYAQQKAIDKLKIIYNNNGSINGIIKAIPGFGKTVLSTYIMTLFNTTTLVLIDNEKLMEQWKNCILEYTNIEEDDIGIIQGTICPTNKKIYLSMVQTLLSKIKSDLKNYYKYFRNLGINLIFVDECHKSLSGRQYVKSSLLFNTPNIIGLSATPFPSEINKILLFNTIGDIIYDNSTYDLKPQYILYKYSSGLGEKYQKQIDYLNTIDFTKGRGKYNNIIVNSESYKKAVLDICQRHPNEKIIIICFTKQQVIDISKYLSDNNIKNIQFYSGQKEVDKVNDRVLVATYKYASHGFDYKELAVLIIATPLSGKTSMIQITGRIVRESTGKTNVYVYDLIDLDFSSSLFNERVINQKISIMSKEFSCEIKHVEVINNG